MSSKFTQKALAHATGQAMTTLLDGREGPELQIIAQRLHSSPYNLSSEEIDDYYDAYCIFPLDSSHHINATSLQIFYENSDITLEYQDAVNALHVFLGQRNLTSIDFEVFVVNMEKWKKKVPSTLLFLFPHSCSLISTVIGSSLSRSIEDGVYDL